MVKYVSVKGKELSFIKADKGISEIWELGLCQRYFNVISITHDYLSKSIVHVWDDYTVSVIPEHCIIAIQDLATGECYYRT